MNKEKVKQALNEKYEGHAITASSIIDIVADAVELSRQDDGVKDLEDSAKALALMGKCGVKLSSIKDVHVTTGSLVVCLLCNGVGSVSSAEMAGAIPVDTGTADIVCPTCKGYGSVKAERNTPSA